MYTRRPSSTSVPAGRDQQDDVQVYVGMYMWFVDVRRQRRQTPRWCVIVYFTDFRWTSDEDGVVAGHGESGKHVSKREVLGRSAGHDDRHDLRTVTRVHQARGVLVFWMRHVELKQMWLQ